MKRIVIKVGTKVLTNKQGVLDNTSLSRIVTQIAQLKKDGHEVTLVSSGAMGAGKSLLKTSKPLTEVSEKQLYAAIGQAHLINEYSLLFHKFKLLAAQVLVTKEDFRDRSHFFNMRNCLETLLHDGIIPIVNENDVVALSELTFTDNDELAGLVASMLNADLLLVLSSIDGVLDDSSKVISEIQPKDTHKYNSFVTSDKSEAGRGGMVTKFAVAKKLAKQGIEVIIANGTKDNAILEIIEGKQTGTRFIASKKLSNTQRRLAHSDTLVRGKVYINSGTVDTLLAVDKPSSLLLVGVVKVEGDFEKGDVIEILDLNKRKIGYGISQYGLVDAQTKLGQKNVRPLIHYDYMFIQ